MINMGNNVTTYFRHRLNETTNPYGRELFQAMIDIWTLPEGQLRSEVDRYFSTQPHFDRWLIRLGITELPIRIDLFRNELSDRVSSN